MGTPEKPNAFRAAFEVAGWMLRNWPTVVMIGYQVVVAVQNLGIYFKTANTTKREVATNVLLKLLRQRWTLSVAVDARLPAIISSIIEAAVAIAKRMRGEAWDLDPLPFGELIGNRSIEHAQELITLGRTPIPTLRSQQEYLQLAIDEFRAIELKNAERHPDRLDARLAAAGLRDVRLTEE